MDFANLFTWTAGPAPDWRDDYEARVYGRPQARYLPERDLDNPNLDPDRELNHIRNL